MTSESRGRLLRLAIAVNLAIIATGFGLLFPTQATALLAVYLGAVAIAAWKGGWEGGVLATAMSTIALLLLFAMSFDASHLVGFIAAAVVVTAIMEAAVPHHRVKRVVRAPESTQFGRLTAVEPPLDEREQEAAKRHELARSLEQAAAAQLEEQRNAARRGPQDAKVTRLNPKDGKRNDRSKRG